MADKLVGNVKWFKAEKGFGFIKKADGSDLFLHFSNIEMDGYKTVSENDEVTYEEGQGPSGRPEAKHVVVTKKA